MRNILQIKVGLRIKDLRAVHDVSQERFANKIGMDRTYLASIEVGQRNVTLQNLAKIANGFDMTLSISGSFVAVFIIPTCCINTTKR